MKFMEHPLYKETKLIMKKEIQRKREMGTLSKAHAEDHIIAVSNIAAATAAALMRGQDYKDMEDRAEFVASIAGIMHDIEREATEKRPHGPAAAKYIGDLYCCDGIKLWKKSLDTDGFDAVSRAVYHHEKSFAEILNIFGDPLKGLKQQILPSVTAHSLLTGDQALEASGPRVIERRAFFVGKERMQEGKDLEKVFRYPDESHLAFLGETLIRLYTRNPIEVYPEWLKPFAQEWHAVQYEVLKGLLRYSEMNEEEAARYMLEKGFTKFTEKLVEKIAAQKHLDGKYFSEEQYPVLYKKIRRFEDLRERDLDELAESAYTVVRFIAESESPEEAIREYENRGTLGLKYADRLMENIISYRSGSEDFLYTFGQKIEDSVRKLKGR